MSHYDWLEKNLPEFQSRYGFPFDLRNSIVSHGDKCYCYRDIWDKAGIPFAHGVALYLLTYYPPYNNTVRETSSGWIAPDLWVIDHYPKFKEFLPNAS